MAGLRSEPSSMTPCSWTFTDVWMSWTPSIMISGSTMGTRPASWQMRASSARSVGQLFATSTLSAVPLGEARALGVVLLAALEEAVEARAPVLAGARADQRSQAHVDLDARDDVVRLEHVDEGLARRVVLEERLLVEDRAGDVLVDARRREEQVAPRLAVRLRVLEADGLEALANRARRLVAGQEALAGQDQGIGGLDELVRVLLEAHLRRRGARGRALLRRERLRRHERRRRRAEGQGEDGGLHRGPGGCTE